MSILRVNLMVDRRRFLLLSATGVAAGATSNSMAATGAMIRKTLVYATTSSVSYQVRSDPFLDEYDVGLPVSTLLWQATGITKGQMTFLPNGTGHYKGQTIRRVGPLLTTLPAQWMGHITHEAEVLSVEYGFTYMLESKYGLDISINPGTYIGKTLTGERKGMVWLTRFINTDGSPSVSPYYSGFFGKGYSSITLSSPSPIRTIRESSQENKSLGLTVYSGALYGVRFSESSGILTFS